jgi:hypothetical protein
MSNLPDLQKSSDVSDEGQPRMATCKLKYESCVHKLVWDMNNLNVSEFLRLSNSGLFRPPPRAHALCGWVHFGGKLKFGGKFTTFFIEKNRVRHLARFQDWYHWKPEKNATNSMNFKNGPGVEPFHQADLRTPPGPVYLGLSPRLRAKPGVGDA